MKKFQELSIMSRLATILGILFVLSLFFWMGAAVGYHQAQFSSRWGTHYMQVFMGNDSPFSSNGANGQVVAINFPAIAVKAPGQAEKIILVGPNTGVRRFHDIASTTDIHLGDMLIAIGTPDDQGRIVATFIRLIPPPPLNQPIR